MDAQIPAIAHGVNRVADEVDQRLPDLAFAAVAEGALGSDAFVNVAFPQLAAKERHGGDCQFRYIGECRLGGSTVKAQGVIDDFADALKFLRGKTSEGMRLL